MQGRLCHNNLTCLQFKHAPKNTLLDNSIRSRRSSRRSNFTLMSHCHHTEMIELFKIPTIESHVENYHIYRNNKTSKNFTNKSGLKLASE